MYTNILQLIFASFFSENGELSEVFNNVLNNKLGNITAMSYPMTLHHLLTNKLTAKKFSLNRGEESMEKENQCSCFYLSLPRAWKE